MRFGLIPLVFHLGQLISPHSPFHKLLLGRAPGRGSPSPPEGLAASE